MSNFCICGRSLDSCQLISRTGCVKSGDLATDAVLTAGIKDAQVTSAKLGTGAALANLAANSVTNTKIAGGFSKVTLASGTAGGADVTVAAMAVGDELVSVLSFTTAASIASVADRTSEYVVAAGKLTKAAGTNETNNQLVIFWNDLT